MKKLMSCDQSSCDLPTEIITLILVKLPIKSIIQCRCVCKSWRSLISTPYFAHQAPPRLLFFSSGHNRHAEKKPRVFFSYDMNDSHVDCNRLSRNNNAMMSFRRKFNLPITHGIFVGSCDGLLCLAEKVRKSYKFYICNPITGEYVKIPGPKVREGSWPMGFYHSSQNNQCKILILDCPKSGFIFTLGSNSWRNFVVPEFLNHHDLISCPVPLDGAIHWIAAEDVCKQAYYICSFDMEREQVKTIAIPNKISSSHWSLRLVVLGDSLCLDSYYEMWEMEEYGVEESWRKHSLDFEKIFKKIRCEVRPLAIKEDGSLLMLAYNKGVLIAYDSRTKKSRNIEIEGNPFNLGAVLYTPSFVPLNVALNIGDQCLKVLNLRSKYCSNQPI